MADDSKTCPVCQREFTRFDFKPPLNPNQWFLRIFCSRKCYFEDKHQRKSNG